MIRQHFFKVVISASLLSMSCNLFNPSDHRDPEPYGPEAMVLEGKLMMRDNQWVEAINMFEKALLEDPGLSEAYFYKGKCILRMAHVELDEVWEHINPDKVDPDIADTSALPFLFRVPTGQTISRPLSKPFYFDFMPEPRDTALTLIDSVFLERKRLYDAVCQAYICLDTIKSNPHIMDGVITRKQYEADFLVEISVKSVLSMVDRNRNQKLDFDLVSGEKTAFKVLVEDVPCLNPDSMSLDSLKKITGNPQEINKSIEDMLLLMDSADASYSLFEAELKEGAEKSDKIDSAQAKPLGDMIAQFRDILPFYYYNDKADNDNDWFDTDGNGLQNPMIWIDWNGNKKIDIDSSDDAGFIGQEEHMENNDDYIFLAEDSTNGYKRFRYQGAYTYEFIAGDWGVDEEIMDGTDNDGDGITDEDTRVVADSLNDDPPGTTKSLPGIWTDANSNFKIDAGEIDTTGGRKAEIDEEWFDGLNNDPDKDNAIDEDIGEGIPPESRRQQLCDSLGVDGTF